MIDRVLSGKTPFDRAVFKDANGPVTAEAALRKPENFRSDLERGDGAERLSAGREAECFFGEEKRYFGANVSVFTFNTGVLIGSSVLLLWLLTGFCAANWKCEVGMIVEGNLGAITSEARAPYNS